jgi:hypothetical protein
MALHPNQRANVERQKRQGFVRPIPRTAAARAALEKGRELWAWRDGETSRLTKREVPKSSATSFWTVQPPEGFTRVCERYFLQHSPAAEKTAYLHPSDRISPEQFYALPVGVREAAQDV